MAKNSRNDKVLSPKQRAKKTRKRIILFAVEIIVLLIMLVVLYAVLKVDNVALYKLTDADVEISQEVAENEVMQGYWNIALFGVDSRTGELEKKTLSDTIMIASINLDTKEVRLVSVFRDTYMNIGNDTYNKANYAYSKGGPKQAITMLNMNMDMNITDFVTVGFAGLVDTIDALGGIMIDVDSAELAHINNYQISIAENLDRSYTPVKGTGYQLLDGMQATAYCRIRYTAGDDFKRAERQREVLQAVAEKVKTASATELNQIANNVFGEVYTSLDLKKIIELLGDASSYTIADTAGFPFETNRTTGNLSVGSSVIPVDLEQNVQLLHEFLFEAEEYVTSETVKKISSKISSDTAIYAK